MIIADEDQHDALRERLHNAKRTLGEAYERRDALAVELAAAEARSGISLGPGVLVALSTAERAVLAAEAEMKDAEYALADASRS